LKVSRSVRFIAKVQAEEETRLIQEFTTWLREEVGTKKSTNGRKPKRN
jgi:hypothetical protein